MFKCEKCGCCCRIAGSVPALKNICFPNGCCKYLNLENNLCSIYENRPLQCRVDDFYWQKISHIMSLKEFYALNKAYCDWLRENNK